MFDFWRVLYVKPRSEKKTANELAMLGLEVYTHLHSGCYDNGKTVKNG
ncbi:MAG: hypothetical protein IPN94_20075 [Sphingobacteriales bacterium]|nr:hypothetical protein [Sphingobacteriales bacterium]